MGAAVETRAQGGGDHDRGAGGIGEAGGGVFEMVTDVAGDDADLGWVARLSADTGCRMP